DVNCRQPRGVGMAPQCNLQIGKALAGQIYNFGVHADFGIEQNIRLARQNTIDPHLNGLERSLLEAGTTRHCPGGIRISERARVKYVDLDPTWVKMLHETLEKSVPHGVPPYVCRDDADAERRTQLPAGLLFGSALPGRSHAELAIALKEPEIVFFL